MFSYVRPLFAAIARATRGAGKKPTPTTPGKCLATNEIGMTTKKEEEQARLEREATQLLREAGFSSSGCSIGGAQAKQRRRDAAIRLGKSPYYFDDYQDS